MSPMQQVLTLGEVSSGVCGVVVVVVVVEEEEVEVEEEEEERTD